jgi:hypothetical protein
LTSNSEKTKAKYFCAEIWTGVMGLKVFAKIIFARSQMGSWNRDVKDSLRSTSRLPSADLPVGLALGLSDIRDDGTDGWRTVCGRTKAWQARSERSILRELACTSLLLTSVFGAIVPGQAAAADNAARIARHVVDNERGQGEHEVVPPAERQRAVARGAEGDTGGCGAKACGAETGPDG